MDFISKMKGVTKSPPGVSLHEIIWSWIGSFLGISMVAVCHFNFLSESDLVMIIGSFGASALIDVIGSDKIHNLGYLYALDRHAL